MKTVFISYGGPDESFAELLERELIRFGAQTFIFSKHAEAGKKLHRVMRDAVNNHDKVILILPRYILNEQHPHGEHSHLTHNSLTSS